MSPRHTTLMTRNVGLAAAIWLASATFTSVPASENPQLYAGQQEREIAALSASDIDDLVNGRGWGFAKAAELNGFPGPLHVLELADELNLSNVQIERIQAVFDEMNADARVLGKAYIGVEALLDNAFESGAITDEALRKFTDNSAQIRARLRATHLSAHLKTKPILTRHQTMTYSKLRGYAEQAGHTGHGNH
ncbi:MAG: hypothetical protein GY947_22005 [Rhodobacteraceae bacterium]|nr:hypothetical protein [Paracoccaceae bacterium]